jgi:hypothetical protein
MIRRVLIPAVVLAFALPAVGCDSGQSADSESTKAVKEEPAANVDLPEPPPASDLEIPEKNDDGTFRVRGLIAHRGQHLDSKVKVRGVITDVSEPCDPARAKQRGESCSKPYLFIEDKEKGADRQLMVVGFTDEFAQKANLKAGDEHVFVGSYKKMAQGFAASESGLLLVDKIDDEKVVQ